MADRVYTWGTPIPILFHDINGDGSAWAIATASSAGGGLSVAYQPNLLGVPQTIKSGAGALGGWYLFNPNVATAYIGVTSAGTLLFTIALPPGGAANVLSAGGITVPGAIAALATTTVGGATALAQGCVCSWFYT
jgi:hypothetical protein